MLKPFLMSVRRKGLPVLLVATTLLGCAAQRMHDEGLTLLKQRRLEEGLAKLEEATKKDPEDFSLRAELIQQRAQVVNLLLTSADGERTAGRLIEATLGYERMLKLDKDNRRAQEGLAKVEMYRRHATELKQAQTMLNNNDLEGTRAILRGVLIENPAQLEAKAMQRRVDEQIAKEAVASPALKATFRKPVSLQFRDANLKMVFEALARTSAINILLDKDVKSDLKITIFVRDATVEDTIDLILMQNQLEKKVLSDNTIFVYPNNPAKIKDFQDLKIRSFQLSNADAKQMQTMLKTLLKTRDLYVDEKTNTLIMRDTPDAVRLAEKLIASEDLAEPEVMLEVEVLEVTRSRLTELGVKLPQQVALSVTGTPATTTQSTTSGGAVVTTTVPAQNLTLSNIRNLNGDAIQVGSFNASIDLRSEAGDANLLASPRIRVRNREKAKILIGDRVPVITNAITPVASGTPVVTGSVQYLDVGLKLDVEPDIHLDDDVAIKVNLEVSTIVRQVNSGPTLAYQIGTRTANTVLRLKDGETQVLAGLINDEDRKTAQKFPGLGDLPILGRLFSSHNNDARKTEIILSITPHLTRNTPRPDAQNVEFWSGTETSLRSRALSLQPGSSVAMGGTGAASVVPPAARLAIAPPRSGQPPAVTAPPMPPGFAPVTVSLQGATQAKVSEEFQVTVDAQTSQALGTLSITLGYDPVAVRIVRVAEGDFLKQNDTQTILTNENNESSGQVLIKVAQVGGEGVTGSGGVATITFSVVGGKPEANISVIRISASSNTGKPLPATLPTPLTVNLTP